ncbi:hypothetical protein Tco_0726512 [Tanacetum coccineum]|uniref:Uncharacterized protein n=1 Tax=Tanacetum coccineum TaxID=301880 RepID=A0ABQ4YGW3_9ASTR
MVAYLEKSDGSEGFHQIINFLTTSHINYALTENPTIYASPTEQFWQTAALCPIEDRVMRITTKIDGKDKVVTEASIRRHLKLEDSDGINTLPNTEVFEQLARMCNMKRASKGYSRVITPLFETMLVQDQGKGPTILVVSHHTSTSGPLTSQPQSTTTVTTLETSSFRITSLPSLSPQIHQSPTSSPLRDITRQAAEIP